MSWVNNSYQVNSRIIFIKPIKCKRKESHSLKCHFKKKIQIYRVEGARESSQSKASVTVAPKMKMISLSGERKEQNHFLRMDVVEKVRRGLQYVNVSTRL